MIGLLALLGLSTDFPPLPEACLPDRLENEQSAQQLTKQPEDCCTCLWLIRFVFGWFEVLNLISTMGKLKES